MTYVTPNVQWHQWDANGDDLRRYTTVRGTQQSSDDVLAMLKDGRKSLYWQREQNEDKWRANMPNTDEETQRYWACKDALKDQIELREREIERIEHMQTIERLPLPIQDRITLLIGYVCQPNCDALPNVDLTFKTNQEIEQHQQDYNFFGADIESSSASSSASTSTSSSSSDDENPLP